MFILEAAFEQPSSGGFISLLMIRRGEGLRTGKFRRTSGKMPVLLGISILKVVFIVRLLAMRNWPRIKFESFHAGSDYASDSVKV